MIPAITERDHEIFRYETMIKTVEQLLEGYPHIISPYDMCFHFFEDKFRASPEMIVDQYEYWGLLPSDYFPFIEKHLKDVKPGWEIDLSMTFENGPNIERVVTHEFKIVQIPSNYSTTRQEKEHIATYYLMAPMPDRAIKR